MSGRLHRVIAGFLLIGCGGGSSESDGLQVGMAGPTAEIVTSWDGLTCEPPTVLADPIDEVDVLARGCVLGGTLQGPFGRWHPPNGVAQQTAGWYQSGKKVGTWTHWDPAGERTRVETWSGGVLHGPFTTFHEGGATYESGDYASGLPDGLWTTHDSAGTLVEEGTWAAGLRDGAWHTYFPTGELAETTQWLAGQRSGTFSAWYPDGQGSQAGEFVADQRDGEWRAFYPDGQPESLGSYTAGLRQGTWEFWKPDGRPDAVATYKDGLGDGPWTTWDYAAFGTLRFEGEQHGGTRHGIWLGFWDDSDAPFDRVDWLWGKREGQYEAWWSDGTALAEGRFLASLREGTWSVWHANGQLLSQGSFSFDRRMGPWSFWYPTGQLGVEATYSALGILTSECWTHEGASETCPTIFGVAFDPDRYVSSDSEVPGV